MTFDVEPLADHDVAAFTCGIPELDTWLQAHATTARGQGTRTYVAVEGDGRVVGFFAVAPHLVSRGDVPPAIGRGAPQAVPAVLLAKLAVAEDRQGQGLGAELLLTALRLVLAAARVAGGRLVVVDAIDDGAARFYQHHDFRPVPQRDDRLVIKLSTVAGALGEPWP